jgi:hypothetical protein
MVWNHKCEPTETADGSLICKYCGMGMAKPAIVNEETAPELPESGMAIIEKPKKKEVAKVKKVSRAKVSKRK